MNKTLHMYKLAIIGVLLFVFISLSLFPVFAVAATAVPSCRLSVTTKYETVTFGGKESVFVPEGKTVQITWSSKGAQRAENSKGDARELRGTFSTVADHKKSFTYTFFSGSKKVACGVTLIQFTASIDEESLSTKSHTPTLGGESEGSKTLELKVYKERSEKALYTAKVKQQKNGEWKSTIKKKLQDGEYTVELLGDKKILARVLAIETLTIGTVVATSKKVDTVLAVETIPLLSGGTTRAGALVPFSYLQVLNIGKKPALLSGFTVMQSGSLPTSALRSLSSVDDTGSFVSQIEGVAGKELFKNGKAFLPTKVTLAPGAMHLFTLKTLLAENVTAYFGTQLKLQVTGISSNAKSTLGTFPIRAVTWTVGN